MAFSQAEVEEDIAPDAGQIDSDEELDIDVLTICTQQYVLSYILVMVLN